MKHTQLIDAVANISGASFVGLDTLTEVKLTGGMKNPQQGRVTKRMTGAQVMAFTNQNVNAYQAMVHRRLDAEGKEPEAFVLKERTWGTRVPNMPIVEHKGAYYLEVIFLKAGTVEFLLDGAPVDARDVVGLPVAGGGEQGGLENKVVIRDFRADSITALRINGKTFT